MKCIYLMRIYLMRMRNLFLFYVLFTTIYILGKGKDNFDPFLQVF